MSFPPLHPSAQNLVASNDSQSSSSGSARPRQPAWGLPAQSGSRRGLAPLATNAPSLSDANPQPGSALHTSSAQSFAPSFSSVLNSSSRLGNSRTSSSTALNSPSLLSNLQTGSQQLPSSQLLSSPRSRANTPFSTSNLVSSAAASTTASQGGGGGSSGSGGPSRSGTFSPAASSQNVTSPTNAVFERNPFGGLNSTSSSSVSKIVITQVFLLLGSITEKEGKAKWETQAEAIRKLVYSNGMEVYSKFFRRLLSGNSPQIFPGISRNVENPGNYPLLVEEVQKASRDIRQAERIAEIIDTSEGDIYRDFDLGTFVTHFKLDPVAQTIFTAAFVHTTKQDLRVKATTLLASTLQPLVQAIANADTSDLEYSSTEIATAAFLILLNLPDNARDGSEKSKVFNAIEARYSKLGVPVPATARSIFSLLEIMERGEEIVHELLRQGPAATSTLENAKEFFRRFARGPLDAGQIGSLLLFTVLAPDADQYRPDVFVSAIKEVLQSHVSWHDVIASFDRENLVISQTQLLSLYQALLPVAQEDPDFDIQLLWGGKWRNKATQLSFAVSFASLSSSQLDATTVPRLRLAYDPREWDDVPPDYISFAEEAVKDPMISLDAVAAMIEGLWDSGQSRPQDINYAKQIIGEKMTLFLSSAGGIPKPWVASHLSLMGKTVLGCLLKEQKDYQWLLHCFWREDKQWMASRLVEMHNDEPLQLPRLLEHAAERGWLEELCTMVSGFGIDLAAFAHRKGLINIRQWASDKLERNPDELLNALHRFLIIKAQDEMRTMRNEQPTPRTVSLSMKTVYTMLEILEENAKDQRDQLRGLERQCMQAFPRLCNYGEGFDDIIETNGADGNNLPETADAEMQDLYKRMYGAEVEVRHVIEVLRECKMSEAPDRQELFACMIHGLFDEFICFNEYPLGPLATTAVLFGGIISYRLINNFALNVALEMVLESVREWPPESSMFKFGLQALLHFLPRLPEWPDFCQYLVQIPGLQGTPAYGSAQEVLREPKTVSQSANGIDGLTGTPKDVNGIGDEFLPSDSLVPQFRSVNVDPHPNPERFEDPEESIQDKVLFVLNNVSEQNLSSKINDLAESLAPKHYQWFASYLVEQRAKSQPNYQQLYLELLGLLGDKNLWSDVLRETFISVRRVLNAESTMKNSIDRAHLKNLGTWLGSLTLARDRPIKHKNIAFKELLFEGFETQRLLLTIPFTCEVLAQGARSVIFKPPNPWVMEVIAVLMELYDLPDLKIQQKFAVEVLLNVYGLPRNGEGLTRSNELVKRRLHFESELAAPGIPDGLDGFNELSVGNLNSGVRNVRFSPSQLASSLPDISEQLVFPPSSGPNQARLRQIVLMAIQRSIMEIIGPVVERSVTIATIATKDLVTKDYALEGDEDRLREALENVAKTTSGSLAAVTCKEPLRMSITNHIRNAVLEMPDQPFPEGAIMMSVNENLDVACKIVEKEAEKRALPEIKAHVDAEIAKRRDHKNNMPNEPYRDPGFSQWSTYIGEPYKLMPGGLNQQQLDIYENFAPQARGIVNHQQNISTDSGKQIPDVLQESGFPNVPGLTTPAEPPALPHQPQPQQPHNNLAMAISGIRSPAQVNGYADGTALEDKAYAMLTEISRLAKETPDQRFKNLNRESIILDLFGRLTGILRQAADFEPFVMQIAGGATQALYSTVEDRFEIEVFVHILLRMCQLSHQTFMTLTTTLRTTIDARVLRAPVTAALLEAQLLEFSLVDLALRRGLDARNTEFLHAFSELLDLVLFVKEPLAMRADFALCFQAISEWLSISPELDEAQSIVQKMKSVGISDPLEAPPDQAPRLVEEQMRYIFQEWITLYNHTHCNEQLMLAFITGLFQEKVLKSEEDLLLFFRLTIDGAIEAFDQAWDASLKQPNLPFSGKEAHFQIDCLARLIVLLVKNQGEGDSTINGQSRAQYMDNILSMIVLILNNHHVVRGNRFNLRSWFRLFSSILYEWHEFARAGAMGREGGAKQDEDMIQTFAHTILLLEPQNFPGFIHGWLNLISHRVFLPAVLSNRNGKGSETFVKILQDMLSYICGISKASGNTNSSHGLCCGALRILLVLHHDFPEFLAQNYYLLCGQIPPQYTQMCNLILSAYPSSMFELPDPFSNGLKVDRLEESRKPPEVDGDASEALRAAGLLDILSEAFERDNITNDVTSQIIEILHAIHSAKPLEVDSSVLQSLVLYLGLSVSNDATGPKTALAFDSSSSQATLLGQLTRELQPEIRYYLLSAIINQLRYPNSHTHYFSHALLYLFGTDQSDAIGTDVRQQITRVLLERIVVHRPHPWGLIVTLMELLKNPAYMFWDLPFTKAVPEIESLFNYAVKV